jgi:RNA-directed DNA polymerase
VLALVKAFLKAGILTEAGDREDTSAGTPQGGILSPLIFNVAMPASMSTCTGRGSPAG